MGLYLGVSIVVDVELNKRSIILFPILFVVLFIVSMVMPNYVLRSSLSYSWLNSNNNISICCVNDTYTCHNIVGFLNKSLMANNTYQQINVIMYENFKYYIASKETSCNMIIGLNEFEYVIAKNKGRIKRIDYFTTYRLLKGIPHDDLLLKSLISAIPYCYSLKSLNTISYVNLTSILLSHTENDRKISSNLVPVKIYRLIIISYSNNIVEKIIEYLLENNSRLYDKKYCESVFYNQNMTTLNDIISFYDIQYIIRVLGDKY